MTGYLSRRNPVCIDTHAMYTQVLSCSPAVIITHSAQSAGPFWRTGTTGQKEKYQVMSSCKLPLLASSHTIWVLSAHVWIYKESASLLEVCIACRVFSVSWTTTDDNAGETPVLVMQWAPRSEFLTDWIGMVTHLDKRTLESPLAFEGRCSGRIPD